LNIILLLSFFQNEVFKVVKILEKKTIDLEWPQHQNCRAIRHYWNIIR